VETGVPACEIELAEYVALLVLVLEEPLVDLHTRPDAMLAANLTHSVLPLVSEVLVVIPLVDGLNALNASALRERKIGNIVDVGNRAVTGYVGQSGLLNEGLPIQVPWVVRVRIKRDPEPGLVDQRGREDMGCGDQKVFHHTQLLPERQTGQPALPSWVLLPLVQVTAENRVLVGEMVVAAKLSVVRLGKRAERQPPVVRRCKCVRVAVVRGRPEAQILPGRVGDSICGNHVIREGHASGERVQNRRRQAGKFPLLPWGEWNRGRQVVRSLRRERCLVRCQEKSLV